MTIHTPWGEAQDVTEHAPGITFVSTASHGGFRISESRVAEMPPALRAIIPFAHRNGYTAGNMPRWYEEDCDWSIVALAFPQHFTDAEVAAAVDTVRMEWDGQRQCPSACAWLDGTPEGRELAERASSWRTDNAHLFRRGCEFGPPGWTINATRIDGRETLRVHFEGPGWKDLPDLFTPAQAEELGGRITERRSA